jgi:hypothetical protein
LLLLYTPATAALDAQIAELLLELLQLCTAHVAAACGHAAADIPKVQRLWQHCSHLTVLQEQQLQLRQLKVEAATVWQLLLLYTAAAAAAALTRTRKLHRTVATALAALYGACNRCLWQKQQLTSIKQLMRLRQRCLSPRSAQ